MKTTSIITIVAVAGLLMLGSGAVYAHCGSCGVGGHKAHAQAMSSGSSMPCGCEMSDKSMTMHHKMNVLKMAEHAGSFTTLTKAIKAAGLEETLMNDGPFTIFAPTDEAFAKLPEGKLEKLMQDKEMLRSVLTYHVHPGKALAADVVKMNSLETVNGQKAAVMVESSGVMIDRSTVTSTDIRCSNGVIHVIDTVMIPKDKSM